jgi:hypothetical protein
MFWFEAEGGGEDGYRGKKYKKRKGHSRGCDPSVLQLWRMSAGSFAALFSGCFALSGFRTLCTAAGGFGAFCCTAARGFGAFCCTAAGSFCFSAGAFAAFGAFGFTATASGREAKGCGRHSDKSLL